MGCACTTSSSSKSSFSAKKRTRIARLSEHQEDAPSGSNTNTTNHSDANHREQRWDQDNNNLVLLDDDDGELPPTTTGIGQGGRGRHPSSLSDHRPSGTSLTDALELVSGGEHTKKTASVRRQVRKAAAGDGPPPLTSSSGAEVVSTGTLNGIQLRRSRGQESSPGGSGSDNHLKDSDLSDIASSHGSSVSSSFRANSARLSTSRAVPHLSRHHSRQSKGGSKSSADEDGGSSDSSGQSDESGAGELFNFGEFHVAVVDELLDERDVTKPYPKRGASRGGLSSSGGAKASRGGGTPIDGRSKSSANSSKILSNSESVNSDVGGGAAAAETLADASHFMDGDPEMSLGSVGDYYASRSSRDGADLFDVSAGVGSEFGYGPSYKPEQTHPKKKKDVVLQAPPFGGWNRVEVKQLGPGASTKIRSLGFAYDAIVTATADDSTAAIYNFKHGNEVTRLSSSVTSVLTCVGSSIDGRLIGTGCRDGTLTVWDGATLKKLWTIHHENAVTNFSFSDDSAYLISCAHDRQSHLWSMKDCRRTRVFGQEHNGPILRALIAPKTQFVLTASTDKTIMLQGVLVTKPFACFQRHRLAVVSVEMLLKSKAFPGWTPPPMDPSAPRRIAFEQDPLFECLVVSCDFRSIYVWSTDTKTTVYFHLLVADFAPHLAPYLCPANRSQPSKENGGQKGSSSSTWSSFGSTVGSSDKGTLPSTNSDTSKKNVTVASMVSRGAGGGSVASASVLNNLNWSGCCIVTDSHTTDCSTTVGSYGRNSGGEGELGTPLVAKLPKKPSLVLAVVTNQRYAALLHLAGDVESLFPRPEQPSTFADAAAAAAALAALVPPPPLHFMRTSQPLSAPILDQPPQQQQQHQEPLVKEMVNFSPLPSSSGGSSGGTTTSGANSERVTPAPNPLIAPRSEDGGTASTFLREQNSKGTDPQAPCSSPPPLGGNEPTQPVVPVGASTPGIPFTTLPAVPAAWNPIPPPIKEAQPPGPSPATTCTAPIPLTAHNISLLPRATSGILEHRFGLLDVYPIRLRSPSFAIASQGARVAIGDTLGNITSVSVELVDQRVFVRKSAAPPTTNVAAKGHSSGVVGTSYPQPKQPDSPMLADTMTTSTHGRGPNILSHKIDPSANGGGNGGRSSCHSIPFVS